MKTQNIKTTFGLPNGFPVSQYDTLKELLSAVDGNESKVVALANKYLRQQPIAEGWRQLSATITKEFSFSPEPKETPVKHCVRFVSAATTGFITVPGLILPTAGKVEDFGPIVWNFLQPYADRITGLKVDANPIAPLISPLKQFKSFPKYARDGAESIITNGTQSKWAATFKKESIEFSDFTVKDDPEGNKIRLAAAIQTRQSKIEANQYK